MKLSFVIVAANAAKYIGDCLASVRAAAAEMTGLAESADIIVVDRASTDATVRNARDIAPEAVIVEAPAGAGFAAAANLGVVRASGDVVIFVDPAVTLCPGAARRLVEHMDTTPACMVAGGMVNGPKDAVLRGAARLPGLIVKLARLSG
ncbi:glycosyltransferase family 2 protein, partial [Desulfovibrio oxamicus]